MERVMISASVLNSGKASGPVFVLTEPLSFWGAYDPRTGKIVDTHHPQSGAYLGEKILLLRETRGSGGTPGGIAEAIRRGTAPLGIILVNADINLAIGAAVAAKLYGKDCPVLSVTVQDFEKLNHAQKISIADNGQITV
jgi:uncharacterized protein